MYYKTSEDLNYLLSIVLPVQSERAFYDWLGKKYFKTSDPNDPPSSRSLLWHSTITINEIIVKAAKSSLEYSLADTASERATVILNYKPTALLQEILDERRRLIMNYSDLEICFFERQQNNV